MLITPRSKTCYYFKFNNSHILIIFDEEELLFFLIINNDKIISYLGGLLFTYKIYQKIHILYIVYIV